jgi:hypothetical protein
LASALQRQVIMDEYARGFSQAVDNFRAMIQGRIDARPESERLNCLHDILHEDIPKMEGTAHALTINGYNRRVVDMVNNVLQLSRR